MTESTARSSIETPEWVVREHARGFHNGLRIESCPDCPRVTVERVPNERLEVLTRSGEMTPLSEALSAGRRLFYRPGLPQQADEPYMLPLDGGPMCERCKGARWLRMDVPVGHPKFGKAIACPARTCRSYQTKKRLDVFFDGLPVAFTDWTFETFPRLTPQHNAVVEKAQQWVDDPGEPWAVLVGPVGVGKTSLACSCIRAMIEQGRSGALKVVPDLLDEIRATFDSEGAEGVSQMTLLQLLYEVDVLVLDDFGKEQDTDWATKKLFQILNRRHSDMKRTILTTNDPLSEIRSKLRNVGEAVLSRVGERTEGNRWVFNLKNFPNMRVKF